MTPQLSFKDLCQFIKEDDPELIESADKLLGLILILSPLVLLPPTAVAAPALGLLAVKNELTSTGKKLFEKITGKKDKDTLAKQQRMEAAYCLICYTAFFEALDSLLPEIEDYIGLPSTERLSLLQTALINLQSKNSEWGNKIDEAESSIVNFKIPLPHPADNFERQRDKLRPLYEELTKGLTSLLESLPLWEQTQDFVRNRVYRELKKLPDISFDYYKAQYFQLATKYEDFYVWSNLQEHRENRILIQEMSTLVQKQLTLAIEEKQAIDLGFEKLGGVIHNIPREIEVRQANIVLDELGRLYRSRIEQLILNDPAPPTNGKPSLSYPKKSEIFIPQSFKVIRYSSGVRLEDEGTWNNLEKRDDLGAFLLSYFSSPYSLGTPLIILGHPGSGKSLLTQIISARLISHLYTPLRVELRDINAENEIPGQIEEQIRKDTSRRDVTWASLTDHLSEQPALVMLDGYDELLQASGQVFRSYLMKVQKFQELEAALERPPVRAVVTSRLTLIDKAIIPDGATVIKLEEFDDERINEWISVWNKKNLRYFKEAAVESFNVKSDDAAIYSLAKQPLLLMMLALYDSVGNQLRSSQKIDQTMLYNSLLRRFIERERKKDEAFTSLADDAQRAEIDKDMERLGVAAIGMFNRRSLHIHATQLNADLAFFKVERKIERQSDQALTSRLVARKFLFCLQVKGYT